MTPALKCRFTILLAGTQPAAPRRWHLAKVFPGLAGDEEAIANTISEFEGRVALVTGGASGLGLATAEAFAERGTHVMIADKNSSGAETAADSIGERGGRAAWAELDIRDVHSVKGVVERTQSDFGRIDVLVNCAGISRGEHQMGEDGWLPMESVEESDWEAVIGVNLTGTFLINREVGRQMIRQKGGRIVNVGSISGLVANAGLRGLGPYNASKAGVVVLTKVLAVEWAEHNVRVNCISPGYMATAMGVRSQRFPDFRRIQIERTPMRRLGEPGEFAAAALYLCSDAAGFLTGHNLVIDGGYTAW